MEIAEKLVEYYNLERLEKIISGFDTFQGNFLSFGDGSYKNHCVGYSSFLLLWDKDRYKIDKAVMGAQSGSNSIRAEALAILASLLQSCYDGKLILYSDLRPLVRSIKRNRLIPNKTYNDVLKQILDLKASVDFEVRDFHQKKKYGNSCL